MREALKTCFYFYLFASFFSVAGDFYYFVTFSGGRAPGPKDTNTALGICYFGLFLIYPATPNETSLYTDVGTSTDSLWLLLFSAFYKCSISLAFIKFLVYSTCLFSGKVSCRLTVSLPC